MISGIPPSDRLPRIRRCLVALVLGMGILAGIVAIPATAAQAAPPGGYCFADRYEFGTNHGDEFKPYGDVRRMTNASSEPVTWTESITVSHTFTSTHTTTTTFTGGLKYEEINIGITWSTSRTVTQSITVNETSTSQTVVYPGETKYMAYGQFGMNTTGTYYQDKFDCETLESYGVKSGTVDSFAMESVGWRVWQ